MENIVTTKVVNQASPELLRSEIDSKIVKIRPMSTPIDQISRHGALRHSGSMKVDYYLTDNHPFETTVTEESDPETAMNTDDTVRMSLKVAKPDVFTASDTILLPEVFNNDNRPVTGYVTKVTATHIIGYFTCIGKNDKIDVPAIAVGAKVVRMGRAARELDVQTDQFHVIPRKQSNYCQIFKTQIEQSTIVRLANKEVGWTFNDQEEAAIIDMRQGMERNFLFGNKLHLKPDNEDDVMLTGGIWTQVGKEQVYIINALEEKDLVKICRDAFTGSNGSSRKLLIAGSDFIEQLHNLDHTRVLTAGDKVTRWGLDFTTFVSKFGTLYVLLSETFDQCGHSFDAMIIDPEYITKYTHIPFNTEKLNLRSSGIRNTDAIVITEASCLVLRYPSAHVRIRGMKSTDQQQS